MEKLIIDRRYLEILAARTTRKILRINLYLIIFGTALIIIGAVMEDIIRLYGFGMLPGLLMIGIVIWRQIQRDKKAMGEFLAYYDSQGELPPWPKEEGIVDSIIQSRR